MARIIFLTVTFFLACTQFSMSQFDGLKKMDNDSVNVYYSDGYEERARTITPRVNNAKKYYVQLLGLDPKFTLLVLAESDWFKYTDFPVYGMPHYKNDNTLVLAAHNNDFWKSFIPPLDQLPVALREEVLSAYKDEEGNVTMQPFFDVLALHELGHAFHLQAGLNLQRRWMGELYVNILLHTYIAEMEPESLPALIVFPRLVLSSGSGEYKYTGLSELEDNFELIATQHPKNYGWYQSRLHFAAGVIYDKAGKEMPKKLWDALKSADQKLSDEEFLRLLDHNGASVVADVIRDWDK